jgi:hypothetical protein
MHGFSLAGLTAFAVLLQLTVASGADPFESAPAPGLDPFRSAPEQAAPKPVPHPRPAPEPEPVAVVPQPAPTPPPNQPAVVAIPRLPPLAEIAARVRQAAQENKIAVPLADSNYAVDEARTPPEYRSLLGPWGPGTWNNGSPNSIILMVLDVDGAGNARVIYATTSARNFSANWQVRPARIVAGKLLFENPNPVRGQPPISHAYELRADGFLHGERVNISRDLDSTITLPPLR